MQLAGAESFRASVLIAEPADAGTCCAALLMLKARGLRVRPAFRTPEPGQAVPCCHPEIRSCRPGFADPVRVPAVHTGHTGHIARRSGPRPVLGTSGCHSLPDLSGRESLSLSAAPVPGSRHVRRRLAPDPDHSIPIARLQSQPGIPNLRRLSVPVQRSRRLANAPTQRVRQVGSG